MANHHIQEWWASDNADVKSAHTAPDGSSVEEHGYFDGETYRAEFRRAVDDLASEVGFDTNGYVSVVIRGGYNGNRNAYQVLSGGDIKTNVAAHDVSVCGFMVMEGTIEEVRTDVLTLIADFQHWKNRTKYTYHRHEVPA